MPDSSTSRTSSHGVGSAVFLAALVAVGIALQFLPEPEETYYDGVTLRTDALFVTSRRWDHAGLEWLAPTEQGIALQKDPPPELAKDKRLLVLVHGYHAPQSRVADYFKDLIAYLSSGGDKEQGIVVYDWTSVEIDWDSAMSKAESRGPARRLFALMSNRPDAAVAVHAEWAHTGYRVDQDYARTSGAAGLAALLRAINPGGHKDVRLIGHSMGCFVVAEAIKQHRAAFADVRQIIFLAPDVPSTLFTDGAVRWNELGPKFDVFYSHHDTVLSLAAPIANWKARLGATGPTGPAPLPSNVVMHDVSDLLGSDGDIHARYVQRQGAELMALDRFLQQ